MIEKERKFLLKYMPYTDCNVFIKQGYLINSDNRYLRIRIVNDKKAFLCFKIFDSSSIRQEFEYEIDIKDGVDLYEKSLFKIEKTRLRTIYNNNIVDIDVYSNGLKTVDIEFEEELNDIPDYCGQEITNNNEYSNVSIAKRMASI